MIDRFFFKLWGFCLQFSHLLPPPNISQRSRQNSPTKASSLIIEFTLVLNQKNCSCHRSAYRKVVAGRVNGPLKDADGSILGI